MRTLVIYEVKLVEPSTKPGYAGKRSIRVIEKRNKSFNGDLLKDLTTANPTSMLEDHLADDARAYYKGNGYEYADSDLRATVIGILQVPDHDDGSR